MKTIVREYGIMLFLTSDDPSQIKRLLNDPIWNSPKYRYKLEQHKIRWVKRYKREYPTPESLMGAYEGARIIIDQP